MTKKVKKWTSQKWLQIQASKFFLSIIMLAIGISYTYCYLMWNYEIKFIFDNSPTVVHGVLQVEAAQAAPISDDAEQREDTEPLPTVEEQIAEVFGEQAEIMLAIAKAESGLRADATNRNSNGSTDTGIFQINSIHGYEAQKLTDVAFNIQCAKEILKKQGLTAWSVYNNGKYKDFL